MNELDVADRIDQIEAGSSEDSAAYILGWLIGALHLDDVRDAMDRLYERRDEAAQ